MLPCDLQEGDLADSDEPTTPMTPLIQQEVHTALLEIEVGTKFGGFTDSCTTQVNYAVHQRQTVFIGSLAIHVEQMYVAEQQAEQQQ
jgi:hypothetical protein